MIKIAEADDICRLYGEIMSIEMSINSNLVGKRARICCDEYRSKRGNSYNRPSLKGQFVRIIQVRSYQGQLYINAEVESLHSSDYLPLQNPLKIEQLELAE